MGKEKMMAANIIVPVIVAVAFVVLVLLAASIRVVKQYERGVHFRLAASSRCAIPD